MARPMPAERGDPSPLEGGFTLLELLIVIVVLGVLAAIVLVAVGDTSARAAVAACRTDARDVAVAVRAYTVDNGAPPATVASLVGGPTPYLESVPASSYYSISTDGQGHVLVAAPPTSASLDWTDSRACTQAGAGSSAVTTTGPAATTTTPTTVVPTTTTAPTTTTTATTTTVAPTTTTTTTTIPGNGVTVRASAVTSGRVLSDALTIDNSSDVTSLTVTITVDATRGERYWSASSTYPRGSISATHSGSSTITYRFTLASRRTISAGSHGVLTAAFTLRAGAHPAAGDAWTVTSTAGGVTATVSGSF